MEWFVGLLLGHLAGDYIFQNSWMALNKKNYLSICTLHCTIYTLCVCSGLYLFGNINPSFLLLLGIFFSHFILDATSIVNKWMDFYGISSYMSCVSYKSNKNRHHKVPDWDRVMTSSQIVQTAFGTFCYIAVDNTIHLIMMSLFLKYFILG